MSERIDHIAEAREALCGSGDGRNFATDASNAAIAHAVLALVEQQRVMNILKVDEMSLRADYEPGEEIREALGIRE